jgi:hypothetical protein
MIIILEGPDGAGKSVLAETLRIRLTRDGWAVITHHHGPYPNLKDPSLYYLSSMRRRAHFKQARYAVILDRSWLSEPIYGEVLRGGLDRVGVASRRMLERVALKCGALVVLCYPPYEACRTNWQARRAQELVPDAAWLRAIHDLYAPLRFLERTNLMVLRYDYAGERGQLDAILEALEIERQRLTPAAGIGLWSDSSTLLVGDRVSRHGWQDLPFVSFKKGGCSAWLATRLEAWGVSERRLYWVNAHEQSPELLGWPQAPKKIVALGQVAARWLERAGLDYASVPHPQAHKRFHFNEEYESLRQVLT